MRLYELIKKLLEEKEDRRNSDKKLMWAVWHKLGYATLSMSFTDFINPNCPTPESITRARRKIQEEYPELQATDEVERERRKKEEQKGTHVYRGEVKPKGHYEFRGNNAIWVEE